MGAVEFFGSAPAYGELHYNLHSEMGQCVWQLEERMTATTREPILLLSTHPVLSRKVALAALKVRAAHGVRRRTNVVWVNVYEISTVGAVWEAVMEAFLDVWLRLDAVETSFFERKLISSGTLRKEPLTGSAPPELAQVLAQISGVEIVVVIDARDASKETATVLDSVISGFDGLIAQHSRNSVALLLLATPSLVQHRGLRGLSGRGGLSIELSDDDLGELLKLLESERVRDSGYGQMRVRQEIPVPEAPATRTAASLALVGQPILDSAVTFLRTVVQGGEEGIEVLKAEGAIERLRNRGLALTNLGVARYGRVRPRSELEESRQTIEANGAHLLSALRPRDLKRLEGSPRVIGAALDRNHSLVEGIGACLAARVHHSISLGPYLGDRLAEMLRTRSIDWSPPDARLLDEVLKYLSLVAFREPEMFDGALFKLTEELTYALNSISDQTESASDRYRRAQRITRLTHLYERAPVGVRQRLEGIGIDTRRFSRQALQALDAGGGGVGQERDVLGTYLAGWLLHDLGDARGGRKRLLEAAARSRSGTSGNEGFPVTLRDTSLSFDLVGQAVFFSEDRVDQVETDFLLELFRDHGIFTSIKQLLDLGHGRSNPRRRLPNSISSDAERWHILFDRRDIGVAIMIASSILFEWRRAIELVSVGDHDDLNVAIAHCRGPRLVIGGPDTPGPIGRYLASKVPDISRLWQMRFNESFYQPVVLQGVHDQVPTILLLTSIVGDGLRAWEKYVVTNRPFEEDHVEPVFFGNLLPTILTSGSKKLTELFIDKVVKAIEDKLEPKAREGASQDLKTVRTVLDAAAGSVSPRQAGNRIEEAFKSGLQSKLVLTGFIDSTDDASLYKCLEEVVGSLAFGDGPTRPYREMTSMLRGLSMAEERRAEGDIDRARKAKLFADGFGNLLSDFDAMIEEYETTAVLDMAKRSKLVNILVSTSTRFLKFAQQSSEPEH